MENKKGNKIYKIIYIGIDVYTFQLLIKEPNLKVLAVNEIQDLLSVSTLSPVNQLFKVLYRLRKRRYSSFLTIILINMWKGLGFLSTAIFRRYKDYLVTLYEKNIDVIDFSQRDSSRDYVEERLVDIVVVNNWWLLSPEIVEAPIFGCINIHPSRLPQYAGSLPTLWSLKNGDKKSAVTFIRLNKVMDSGDILQQYMFDINQNDDSLLLEKKIESIIEKHLVNDLFDYMSGKVNLTRQNMDKRSLTGKYIDYMEINWETETAWEIYNKIVLYPYLWLPDKCYFKLRNKKIKISGARYLNEDRHESVKPGTYWFEGRSMMFKCKKSFISLSLFNNISFLDSLSLLICPNKTNSYG